METSFLGTHYREQPRAKYCIWEKI